MLKRLNLPTTTEALDPVHPGEVLAEEFLEFFDGFSIGSNGFGAAYRGSCEPRVGNRRGAAVDHRRHGAAAGGGFRDDGGVLDGLADAVGAGGGAGAAPCPDPAAGVACNARCARSSVSP